VQPKPDSPLGVISRRERRIMTIEDVMAAVLAIVALFLQWRIEPLPDGTTALEALLSPRLWSGLMLDAGAYFLLAAAAGIVVGTISVAAWLLFSSTDERRRRLVLMGGPVVGAVLSILIGAALL
jgi:hypothetical protein